MVKSGDTPRELSGSLTPTAPERAVLLHRLESRAGGPPPPPAATARQ